MFSASALANHVPLALTHTEESSLKEVLPPGPCTSEAVSPIFLENLRNASGASALMSLSYRFFHRINVESAEKCSIAA